MHGHTSACGRWNWLSMDMGYCSRGKAIVADILSTPQLPAGGGAGTARDGHLVLVALPRTLCLPEAAVHQRGHPEILQDKAGAHTAHGAHTGKSPAVWDCKLRPPAPPAGSAVGGLPAPHEVQLFWQAASRAGVCSWPSCGYFCRSSTPPEQKFTAPQIHAPTTQRQRLFPLWSCLRCAAALFQKA